MSGGSEPRGAVRAGLYVHVPFCSAICPYCDFAVAKGKPSDRTRFVNALVAEIERAPEFPFAFDTVYFGGGTPSSLELDQLGGILGAIRRGFRFHEDCQVSLEVNPEDVTEGNLAAWRSVGVRTISLGVQSFDPGELRFLGRRHTAGAARRAVRAALAEGFPIVSIDLIYGLPGQEPAGLRATLEQACALAPQHLSCYQLTVSEGTPFGRRRRVGRLRELGDERQAECFSTVHRFLGGAGYDAYEVSNFARSAEHRSRHNQKYWSHAPYLGIGPSAHSFDGRRRWWNIRSYREYDAGIARGDSVVAECETLSARELALESVMLGLRTAAGVDLERFRRQFGFDLAARNAEKIERAIEAGTMQLDGGWLRPTLEGWAIADALAASLTLDDGDRA